MNKDLKDKIENTMYEGEDTSLLKDEIIKLKDNIKKSRIELERKE